MATIGRVLVEIGVKGSAKATRDIRKFTSTGIKAVKRLTKLFTILSGLIAGRFIYSLNKASKRMDFMAKKAQLLGADIEVLQAMALNAELAGVSFEQLSMGMQRMVRRVSEASKGLGEAQEALRALGLDAMSLTQLKPEQQMRAIGRALNAIGNQNEKIRLAFKIFDSEGVAILRTFNGQLDKTSREMRELGIVLSKEQTDKLEKYNDAVTKTGKVWQGLKSQLAAILSKPATDFLNWIQKSIKDMGGMEAVANKVAGALAAAFSNLVGALSRVVQYLMKVRMSLANIGKTTQSILMKVFGGGAALAKGVGAGFGQLVKDAGDVANQMFVQGKLLPGQAQVDSPGFFGAAQQKMTDELEKNNKLIQQFDNELINAQQELKQEQMKVSNLLGSIQKSTAKMAKKMDEAAVKAKAEHSDSQMIGMPAGLPAGVKEIAPGVFTNIGQGGITGGAKPFSGIPQGITSSMVNGVPTFSQPNQQNKHQVEITVKANKDAVVEAVVTSPRVEAKIEHTAEKTARNNARQVAR